MFESIGKIVVVALIMLLIMCFTYLLLSSTVSFIKDCIEKLIDKIYADEIKAEKERTENLLREYGMEMEKIDIEKDEVYTKIF